ncbi:MAG: tetratricopeptide repeat protein [Methanobacterium formicicum]
MGLFNRFKKGSLIKKAYNLFTQSKYQEALKCYNEILEMDPEDMDICYNKGVVLERL